MSVAARLWRVALLSAILQTRSERSSPRPPTPAPSCPRPPFFIIYIFLDFFLTAVFFISGLFSVFGIRRALQAMETNSAFVGMVW